MKTHKKSILGILTALLLVSLNGVYYIFFGQQKSAEKLNKGQELNLYEKCSIYTMHCAVWGIGWVISPAAAWEALLLHFPHKDEQIVYEGIDMYAANGFSTELKARGSDYAHMSISELRYALALNSINTVFDVTEEYSMCSVRVEYTDAVSQIGPIPIRTSLFNYLQKKGWLFPYTIVYMYYYV